MAKKKNKIVSMVLICFFFLEFFFQQSYNVYASTPTIIKTLPKISMPKSINENQSITANWDSINGASSYMIALLDQTTGEKPINDYTIYETSYTIETSILIEGHNYKFWVGATNAAGTNAGSAEYFTVTNNSECDNYVDDKSESTIVTEVPDISMPKSVDENESITANWDSINGASSYMIALLDQTTGEKPINDYTIYETSYTIETSILTAGHNYKFWVGATNAAGTNAGSVVYFTVNESNNKISTDVSVPSSEGTDEKSTNSGGSVTVENNETITNPLTTWNSNYIRYNPDTNEIEVELPISPDDKNNFYMTVYDENLQPLYGGISGEATYDTTTEIFPYKGDSRKYKGRYFTSFIPGCTPNKYSTQKLNLEYGKTYRVGIRTKGFESSMVSFTKDLTLPSLIDGWNVTTSDNSVVINNSQLKNTAIFPKFKCTINGITKDIGLSNTFTLEEFNLSSNKSYDVFLQIDDNGKLYEQQKIGSVEIQQSYDSKDSNFFIKGIKWRDVINQLNTKSHDGLFNADRSSYHHRGIDVNCSGVKTGVPVYACADGTIYAARDDNGGEGCYVSLKTDEATFVYMHLNKFWNDLREPPKPKNVKKGDFIGEVGNTGHSTGPHLHFEIRLNNRDSKQNRVFNNDKTDNTVDPVTYFTGMKGTKADNNGYKNYK